MLKRGENMVIITDCKYRNAISAIHTLHKLGEKIVAVTTDSAPNPPAFHSRYIYKKFILPDNKEEYTSALLELCQNLERPTILPIGVFTLNILASNKKRFSQVADFCVASTDILDTLNDKKQTKELARRFSIPVPEVITSEHRFPIVVKPFCGEKFALKASDRYKIVNNEAELQEALSAFSKYDSEPIIEKYIEGVGVGVSLVIDSEGRLTSAFCHKRLAEYPADGGPSCALKTFYDGKLVDQCYKMLASTNFSGIAMLEFKEKDGKYYFLEINPRIWGSFCATYCARSNFLTAYLHAARKESYSSDFSYNYVTVKFFPNILASFASYLKARRFENAFKTLLIAVNPLVKIANFSIFDPQPILCDIFRKRR